MTLIIGCITNEYGIIIGDTQLSVGDLDRGNIKKEIEIKVSKYGSDFMMGILGKWSWFSGDGNGKATYINEYDSLQKVLNDYRRDDKLDSLSKFLVGRENIDATSIYVKRDKNGYELDMVSSKDSTDLKRIKINGKEFVFNEPFFHYDNDYIQNKIIEFNDIHELTDSLPDTLFLLNNICLSVIAEGNALNITKNGIAQLGITSSVGGYLTIQIITNDIHHFNCLYQPYSSDLNVLLDKTTHPFSHFVNDNKVIRYIDNLAMLIKSSTNHNISVHDELFELINKQINFLAVEEIIESDLLNILIEFINEKYNIKIVTVVKEHHENKGLQLFLDDGNTQVDIEYLKRFF